MIQYSHKNMAENKKVTISRTRNEDNVIYYIARNSSGTIFARTLTLKELEIAIKTYKEPPPIEENPSASSGQEGKEVSIKGEEATAGETKKESKEKKFLT